MELTEDIISGVDTNEEHVHYVEENLLVFRDIELKKLFQLLETYYEDNVKDLEVWILLKLIIDIITLYYFQR